MDLDSTQIEDLVAELAGDLQILSGVACLLMMLHMTVQSCSKLYQVGFQAFVGCPLSDMYPREMAFACDASGLCQTASVSCKYFLL